MYRFAREHNNAFPASYSAKSSAEDKHATRVCRPEAQQSTADVLYQRRVHDPFGDYPTYAYGLKGRGSEDDRLGGLYVAHSALIRYYRALMERKAYVPLLWYETPADFRSSTHVQRILTVIMQMSIWWTRPTVYLEI